MQLLAGFPFQGINVKEWILEVFYFLSDLLSFRLT